MSKLTNLRKLAKRASKGPWVEDDGNIFSKPQQEIEFPLRMKARGYGSGVWDGLVAKCGQTLPNFERDAYFIAACDPQTILALLDALKAYDKWQRTVQELPSPELSAALAKLESI